MGHISSDLEKTLEEFFEVYAIDFKNNNTDIPHYVLFRFMETEEYDDNNYYDTVKVSDVLFFDQNKQTVDLNFEVESDEWYGKTEIKWVLRDTLSQIFDYDEEDMASEIDGQYLKIKKGA